MKGAKKRLQEGETLHGCWLNLGSSLTAEIVGQAGFDWVLIDLEHGAGNEKDVLYQLQALQHTSAAPVVRVESLERQRIHRVLDLGAEGVMCPRIRNFEEAEQLAGALRYPPGGSRGVAKMVRATGFGDRFEDYHRTQDQHLLGILQVETPDILEDLDRIAELKEIDVLFVGPADLSMALGVFGQLEHPLFLEALDLTVQAARKAGKVTGILLFDPDDYPKYRDMGIQLIACGADATFVTRGARNMAEKLNAFRSK